MKKWIQLIIFVFVFMPISVVAKEGISNYYIDMKVEKNGDVTVEELFVLEGSFNGYERIINFKGSTKPFDGSLSSFNGSDLYNGDSVIIKEVASVSISNDTTFADLKKEKDFFQKHFSASTGSYGIYTVENTQNGEKIRIYNPSYKNQRGFYIKYVITNMAIVHNDIAEIGFNLFTEEQTEAIDRLEMHIHLLNNQTELRAWGHGPLWGETKNLSQEEIHLYIDELDAYQPVDVRFVFDKNVVSNSTKMSDTEGLPSILKVETQKAEEANQLRENLKKSVEKKPKKRYIYFFIRYRMVDWTDYHHLLHLCEI